MFRATIAFLLACASLAPRVDGQAVGPQRVSFYPSPDHDATDADGVHLVSWYGLQFHEYGNPQAFLMVNFGKPDPGPDGRIDVDLRSMLRGPLLPGVVLEARVVAFGPGGRGESDPSNPFVFELQAPARPNAAPTVRVKSPANGARVVLSPRIALVASVADADGTIAWVAFYIDSRLVAVALSAPYTVWWPNPTPGTHTVAATAADNDGAQAVSPSISVTVSRVPLRPLPPGAQPAGPAKPRPPAKPRVPR